MQAAASSKSSAVAAEGVVLGSTVAVAPSLVVTVLVPRVVAPARGEEPAEADGAERRERLAAVESAAHVTQSGR